MLFHTFLLFELLGTFKILCTNNIHIQFPIAGQLRHHPSFLEALVLVGGGAEEEDFVGTAILLYQHPSLIRII